MFGWGLHAVLTFLSGVATRGLMPGIRIPNVMQWLLFNTWAQCGGELRYQVCVSFLVKFSLPFYLLGWLIPSIINWREISNVLQGYTLEGLAQAHVCPTAFPNAAMEEWFPTENALRVPLLHHSLSAFFLVPSYLVLIQGILCIAWFLVLPKWMRTKQDFFGGLFHHLNRTNLL